jgi:hypothetical protein
MKELYSFHDIVGKRITSTMLRQQRSEQFHVLRLSFSDNTFIEFFIPSLAEDSKRVEINPLDHEQTK